jgi:hypothetical protein
MNSKQIAHPGQSEAMRQGGKQTPEYVAYNHALARCRNITLKSYPDYGGRGIKFLFESFEQFLAEIGPRPTPKHSLDRKDNNSHYAPGNVRWATRQEQVANRRKYSSLEKFTIEELLTEIERRKQ